MQHVGEAKTGRYAENPNRLYKHQQLQVILKPAPADVIDQYLGSLDNPALIVYRIRPVRVRFMKEWALDYHEVAIDVGG